MENILPSAPNAVVDLAQTHHDDAHRELKRGAWVNTLAMFAANFRAVFTLLIARLLGPVSLGLFSVAWATTDLISKLGVIGLDDGVTTFVARAHAAGDIMRARSLLRIAAAVSVVLSIAVTTLSIFAMRFVGAVLQLQPELVSALSVLLFAMPGIALYRISNSVSRGMKVMEHDIYSRGFTESGVTTLAFLGAFALGSRIFAPEIAAIIGSSASGLVAFALASRLFRNVPNDARERSTSTLARDLLSFSLPIGVDQFLNAFIWRIDVILLGCLVGRVPGVTLTTLGIYGAVVGLANGLRKVSQAFTPIFAPVVAGMTSSGAHDRAMATYAQLAQWMLWILLPFVAVLTLAGNTILLVYGPAFQSGGEWLAIVAIACATNAFITLGETVIMVQRPGLNLLNSFVTCLAGIAVTYMSILRWGVFGAAIGILATYLIQGAIRNLMLRVIFHWHNPWSNVSPPIIAALIAALPAIIVRSLGRSIAFEIGAAILFLIIFAWQWRRHHVRIRLTTS
jgi:O-antigen/teichoic acid export membrane protein